jgi:hypothetical protein
MVTPIETGVFGKSTCALRTYSPTTRVLCIEPRAWGVLGKPSTLTYILNPLSYCKKNDLLYQSICYPLRLLKIPQIAILGDLHG